VDIQEHADGSVVKLGDGDLYASMKDDDGILEGSKSVEEARASVVALSESTLFRTSTGIMSPDDALRELVIGENTDEIVLQILARVPEGFLIEDNGFGEVEHSIKVWLQESATNAIRHIGYREGGQVPYDIQISSSVLMEGGNTCLRIAMKDNGIGIRSDYLEKIGREKFTISAGKQTAKGRLHQGGNGLFFYLFKKDNADPRGWRISIQNREDGEQGAVSFLTLPLKKVKSSGLSD